ncbi:MAG: hypothetical protein U0264_14415 [Candidatus Kapaibacterium sp.]
MKLCITILVAITFWMPISAKETSRLRVKKVSVIESNNKLLDENVSTIPFTADLADSYITDLKQYVSRRVNSTDKSDPAIILSLLEWVSNQWQHDGVNAPPARANALEILTLAAQGGRFSCNSYSTVLSDVLLAYGYISRVISLNSKDIAYGTLGMGHVAVEVWSNSLQKWIFIDPQYSVYATYHGEYLNYYDIYRLRAESKYNEIEFHVANSHLTINHQTKDEAIAQYRSFLSEYFGYIVTPYEHAESISMLVLPMESKDQFLTNQGRTSYPLVFTEEPEDFYFSINTTLVVFTQGTCTLDRKHSDTRPFFEETEKSAGQGIPESNFTLQLRNNMPWFDHYEYKNKNNVWVSTKHSTLPWKVSDGVSTFTVRAVNMAGVAGVPTSIKLKYE